MTVNDDVIWFKQQASRQARIRSPVGREFHEAWRMLGMHDETRRRVLVWRVPHDNPGRKMVPDGLMRIPFVARADETIEDSDAVLLKVLADLMRDAGTTQPVNGIAITQEVGAFPGWGNG